MADDVGDAVSSPDVTTLVTAMMSMPEQVLDGLDEEAARWGLNRGQMLGIAFDSWMVLQGYVAKGFQVALYSSSGELFPIKLVAGSTAPEDGHWPLGQRPDTSETAAIGNGGSHGEGSTSSGTSTG